MANSAWLQSKLTIATGPRLNWDIGRNKGVTGSGWNPFLGLRCSLIDESLSKDKVSLYIEPSAPGISMFCFMTLTPMIVMLPVLYPIAATHAQARGYFFSKNPITGKIDLFHRIKPFRGEEIRVVYEDVTYFGIKFTRDISFENLYTSSFVLTFKDGQISIPNGECFVLSHHVELDIIIAAVNALISRSMENRIDLNSVIYPILSTGRADEHAAIPFAASCMAETRNLAETFADCTVNAEAIRGKNTEDVEHSLISESLPPNITFTPADSIGPILFPSTIPALSSELDVEVQEALLIPDTIYRQPYARNDFPNIPY